MQEIAGQAFEIEPLILQRPQQREGPAQIGLQQRGAQFRHRLPADQTQNILDIRLADLRETNCRI